MEGPGGPDAGLVLESGPYVRFAESIPEAQTVCKGPRSILDVFKQFKKNDYCR